MGHAIGVDIGGTFTDCVAFVDGRTVHAKTLSTHASSPSEGVLRGISLLAEASGCSVRELLSGAARVSHGTTIGTNLVVERKGARTALVTTAGHGDMLSMMRGSGRTAGLRHDEVFDIRRTRKPEPLCLRSDILEIHERVDCEGRIVVPLDEGSARAAMADLLADEAIEALAIVLLWSFRNPGHEYALARIAREIRPALFVSLSSDVSPRLGEYERCVATVMNAYIGPASRRYLRQTEDELKQAGLAGPFMVMQANGGVVPVGHAERLPLATLDSGPTGGLSGCAALARALGHRNVIATDMGGTSFDVGLIVDGSPVVAEERVLNQYAYRAPHLDMRSIACGGGSIARLDPATSGLRVGPDSAGSSPGPVCYRRGGEQPTVTDADLVTGLLRADGFLDGKMALDLEGSVRTLARLGAEIGLSAEAAAAGIIQINNHAAADLIRQRTVEQGLDPRDFTLYAFGGAGPVHAFGFAAELGVREVVIPLGNGASTLSAYGIAGSDVVRFFERECRFEYPLDAAALENRVESLRSEARDALAGLGLGGEAEIECFALIRFVGQLMQSLPVRLPDAAAGEDLTQSLHSRFLAEYARLYGEGAVQVLHGIEIFALRVRASIPFDRSLAAAEGSEPAAASPESRRVFWPDEGCWTETGIWHGADLPDHAIAGPALVELPHATVAIAAGQSLLRHPAGHLVLSLTRVETE